MWLRRVGLGGAGLAVALAGALAIGVGAHPSVQRSVPPSDPIPFDRDALAHTLSRAIAIPTVSRDDAPPDAAAFEALRALLAEAFPQVHATLQVERVAEHTLVYTWPGADPSLPVGVLMAHQDVVPADPAGWSYPPFAGTLADGFVVGRGALDDKNNLVAQLAALEWLVANGFHPARTVVLVAGHDEEVGGHGAESAAAAIVGRGPVGWVLDEGGPLLHRAMGGLAAPAALVGVAEKGYATVELAVSADGGHASMPPPSTAAGRIAAAVARIEANPMPARLEGPSAAMLDAFAPEVELPLRVVMSNRWLTGPLVRRILAGKSSTNASIRTTAAVTMLSGSDKENVLPRRATARINLRLLPGDTVDEALDHLRRVIDDPEVSVAVVGGFSSEASAVSRWDGPVWDQLADTIRAAFPDAAVAPFLMVGATDARRFAPHCDAVFRFSPFRLDPEDLQRLHGVDERVSVDALPRAAGFYVRWLEAAAGPG